MKRRLIILTGIVAIAALAIWVVLAVTTPTEPVFQGKKLSAWVDECGSTNSDRAVQARFAIGRMGSNAVPYLMHRLKREALKTYWLKKTDGWLHTGTKFEQMNATRVLAVRRGILGLRWSGVPELEKLVEESTNEEVVFEAYSTAEMIRSLSSDSRLNSMHLSSNAKKKVVAAMAAHGRTPPLDLRVVAIEVGPMQQESTQRVTNGR